MGSWKEAQAKARGLILKFAGAASTQQGKGGSLMEHTNLLTLKFKDHAMEREYVNWRIFSSLKSQVLVLLVCFIVSVILVFQDIFLLDFAASVKVKLVIIRLCMINFPCVIGIVIRITLQKLSVTHSRLWFFNWIGLICMYVFCLGVILWDVVSKDGNAIGFGFLTYIYGSTALACSATILLFRHATFLMVLSIVTFNAMTIPQSYAVTSVVLTDNVAYISTAFAGLSAAYFCELDLRREYLSLMNLCHRAGQDRVSLVLQWSQLGCSPEHSLAILTADPASTPAPQNPPKGKTAIRDWIAHPLNLKILSDLVAASLFLRSLFWQVYGSSRKVFLLFRQWELEVEYQIQRNKLSVGSTRLYAIATGVFYVGLIIQDMLLHGPDIYRQLVPIRVAMGVVSLLFLLSTFQKDLRERFLHLTSLLFLIVNCAATITIILCVHAKDRFNHRPYSAGMLRMIVNAFGGTRCPVFLLSFTMSIVCVWYLALLFFFHYDTSLIGSDALFVIGFYLFGVAYAFNRERLSRISYVTQKHSAAYLERAAQSPTPLLLEDMR